VDQSLDGQTLVAELANWAVTLGGGDVVVLHAHAYSREGDEYVFTVLMEGTPHYEVAIAKFPVGIVSNIIGG
jgi:hypothetical protein